MTLNGAPGVHGGGHGGALHVQPNVHGGFTTSTPGPSRPPAYASGHSHHSRVGGGGLLRSSWGSSWGFSPYPSQIYGGHSYAYGGPYSHHRGGLAATLIAMAILATVIVLSSAEGAALPVFFAVGALVGVIALVACAAKSIPSTS